jgi:hypothetical protein
VLPGGEPFPTLLWLTCPWLCQRAGAEESAGGADAWSYRLRRAEIARGIDPCAGTGIAGQRDSLSAKCLHAHIAAAIGGFDDPIGLGVLARADRECPDDRCAAALVESGP